MATLHLWARPAWPPHAPADLAACADLRRRATAAEFGVVLPVPALPADERRCWADLGAACDHHGRSGFLTELAGLAQTRCSHLASGVLHTLAATEWDVHRKGAVGAA